MIRFHCPCCDKILKAPDENAGAPGVCPRCGERSVVPAERPEIESEKELAAAEESARPAPPQYVDEALSLFSGMSPKVWWTVVLVAGAGVLGVLVAVVAHLVPPLAPAADPAKYGAMTIAPLSVVTVLVILYGHGSSCPSCAKWWARHKVETVFVDRVVIEKEGTPFARATYRTHYGCDSCGHRWSETSTEEFKKCDPAQTRTRLG